LFRSFLLADLAEEDAFSRRSAFSEKRPQAVLRKAQDNVMQIERASVRSSTNRRQHTEAFFNYPWKLFSLQEFC